MRDPRFLCTTPESAELVGRPEDGERVMWRGRTGVAEYAFDQHGSLPRWTLPESTQVLITDRRAVYAYFPEHGDRVTGELRWLWPQYLRVQPGARSADRAAAVSQIQLVCAGADGGFPALVLAGGDLVGVGDADRLANTMRLSIARFRVDHLERLGLAGTQTRMLSRLLIGPEFSNRQGGEGQTVSLAGSELVPARPASAAPHVSGVAPVPNRPLLPGPMPVAGAAPVEVRSNGVPPSGDTRERITLDNSAGADEPTADQTERAERLRRSAARFSANSARGRAAAPHRDAEGSRQANTNY